MTRKQSRLDGKKTDGDKPVVRDSSGRFVKGSASPSPGRPTLALETEYKDVVRKTITPDALAELVHRDMQRALDGDDRAAERIYKAAGMYLQRVEVDADIRNAQVTVYLPMLPELDIEDETTGGYMTDDME